MKENDYRLMKMSTSEAMKLPEILTKEGKKMYLNRARGIYKDHPTSGKSKCKCRDYTYDELTAKGYK